MKLFPVHSVLWSGLLVLWVSQSAETNGDTSDVCQEDMEELVMQNSTGQEFQLDKTDVKETCICLHYPTNILNCSWAFHTLETDTQLSVYISVCDDDATAVQSQSHASVDRVGSLSLTLSEEGMSRLVVRFNMSLHDKWTTYTYMYEKEELEVLSPPPNISTSVKDGSLHVAWDLPHCQSTTNPSCFEYQLDMGGQEPPRNISGKQSYTEPNAEPTRTYTVRVRTRVTRYCYGSSEWSDWSPTVTVQSVSKLNPLVIISISLGVPMILLAVLLLVRHQRVTKVLFPPIPRPPLKYKHFLEKNDPVTFFQPAPSAKPEEEITEVEDAEPNPGKTL